MAVEKGAGRFDQKCHSVFDAKNNGESYLARETGMRCGICRHELKAFYCEEELYLVECECCEVKVLVKAPSPTLAASRTLAHDIYPVEDMNEDIALFFDHVPINEPPCYVGSTIDCNFPDNARYGMYLPNPATDGSEYCVRDDEN